MTLPHLAVWAAAAGVVALVMAACGSPGPGPAPAVSGTAALGPARPGSPVPPATPSTVVAAPAHIVIVMMENASYSQVIGNPAAPYINALARRGALFTNSHGVTHPSEPNYLALFSGRTQGVTDDSCPHTFTGPNLASELIAAHHTFAGYAEALPSGGARVCVAGEYARKHVPWVNFRNVPAAASKSFSAFPSAPAGYATLPTVSMVIPGLCHDTHDCSLATGDAWLKAHLAGYADWAMTHRSLLILTWDENDGSPGNQIATIFAGQQVRPGRYGEPVTHYGVLRTIEYLYRLPPLGAAASAHPITAIWG